MPRRLQKVKPASAQNHAINDITLLTDLKAGYTALGGYMLFWIICALLCAIVALAMIWPLRETSSASGQNADLIVYRDQLAEVDRDLMRGVLSQSEASTIKTEVSRRILTAGQNTAPVSTNGPISGLAIVMISVLFGGAFAGYFYLGAANYPDLPLKTRLADAKAMHDNRPSQAEMEAQAGPDQQLKADPQMLELIVQLRAKVAANPKDQQGFTFLAGYESQLGNYRAAARAQKQLLAVKADTANARDHSAYATYLVLAAGGNVSPQAEVALNAALALDPKDGAAIYFKGLLYAQTGRPDIAFQAWKALLENSKPDDPWVAPIRISLETMAQLSGIAYELPAETKGPSQDDIDAAAALTPEQRQKMISEMVDGLAERLLSEGGSLDQWVQLIGAMSVTKDPRLADVFAKARAAFTGDEAATAAINQAAAKASDAP
jgi:cytochrome c-type biogenesis protein CcmH